MKSRTLLLVFMAFLPFAVIGQKNMRKTLESKIWTDGTLFYNLEQPDGNSSILDFFGATLHEGGITFTVQNIQGQMTVVDGFYATYKAGDRVEYRKLANEELLLIYDGNTGKVIDALKALPAKQTPYEATVENLRRYALAGNYVREDGEFHAFSPKEYCVTGFFSGGCDPYTFAHFYQTPILLIVFNQFEAYDVTKTRDGLILTQMKRSQIEDSEPNWENDKDGSDLVLTKTGEYFDKYALNLGLMNIQGKYPYLSAQVMTRNTLMLYAGSSENLKIMRNEIYARHGYIFKTTDMKNYFGAQDWYRPQYDDVSSRLTEIEQINISLIQALESDTENCE